MNTVIALASGPSLTAEQIALLNATRLPVMAVNRSWIHVPSAAWCYAGDWIDAHKRVMTDGYQGQIWTQSPGCNQPPIWRQGAWMCAGRQRVGLCREPYVIHHGGNSGHQALNLLYHFGFERIILVGYDFLPGPNGEQHSHPDHPPDWGNFQHPEARRGPMSRIAVDLADEGVEVINCSERTSLDCWPRASLSEVLCT